MESNDDVLKEILILIKDFPNDYELGKKIRAKFKDKKKDEKDDNQREE